jgi:predicted CoA-binding protein
MVTLVLGASTKPERYSYQAVDRLLSHGHSIIALGSRAGEIRGNALYTEKKMWSDIDTISLYLGPHRQEEYYDYIFSLNPRRVLFNPGTENPFFEDKLIAAGILAERACTLVLLATNQY